MKKERKERILALLYPHRCFLCDKVIPFPADVCEKCAPKLIQYTALRGAVCEICGLKLNQCCCRQNRLYEKAVFPLLYDKDTRMALHRFKFRGRKDLAKPLARAIKAAAEERGITGSFDLLTYIPMGKKALRKRGYNQALLLCEALAEECGLPVLPLLYKYEDNATQHDLKSFLYRSGNILGVFEPDPQYVHEIEDKRILIVDDILTTGATLNEAAKTLLIFGAQSVSVAAAAAVPKKKRKKGKK